jgi:DHA2 family multidrug resistance protein
MRSLPAAGHRDRNGAANAAERKTREGGDILSATQATSECEKLELRVEQTVNPWLVTMTVILATFMELLDTSIANVALPHIAGNLSSTIDESTYVLTSYLIANAIILPLSGWFSETFGRKRFYMGCVVIFTFSSLCCGMAPSLSALVFCRIIQGLGGGGLQPSAQAIIADTFPKDKLSMAFSVYGMAVVVAPAIGPSLGGWVTDNYSWRWLFYVNVPLGIISLLLTSRLIHEHPRGENLPPNASGVDWQGMGLLALGLGALEFVLDRGQEDDWFGSERITVLAIVSAVSIIAVICRELMIENPIVDLRLFRQRNYSLANILVFFLGFMLAGSTVLLPQFLQTLMGYSATLSGNVLTPGASVYMLILPIVAMLIRRTGPRPFLIVGYTIVGISMWLIARLNLNVDFATVAEVRIVTLIGLACLFTPISLVCYSSVPPGKNNAASALYNLLRNLGASVGVAAVTTIVTRRAQIHQSRLVEHITVGSPLYQTWIAQTSRYIRLRGNGLGTPTGRATALLYRLVVKQATTMAYLDTFWILGTVCFIMPIFALLLRRVAAPPKAPECKVPTTNFPVKAADSQCNGNRQNLHVEEAITH